MTGPPDDSLTSQSNISASDNEGGETAIATSTSRLIGAPRLPAQAVAELREVAERYPHPRSALLPMLHLVQSVEGHVTPAGIETCARILELTAAEVSAVATFYTMYKRRPVGDYHVGVCTNTLCAVMGGDVILERLKAHLDIGNDETTEDGQITLEHIECNAACDYAPVVMVNWEFFDNQTPQSAVQLVDDLRDGRQVQASRGAAVVTWREAERVLAGFPDGRADEGPAAGPATLVGLRIARERGWSAPPANGPGAGGPAPDGSAPDGPAPDGPAPDGPASDGGGTSPREAAGQSAYSGQGDVAIAESGADTRTGKGNDAS